MFDYISAERVVTCRRWRHSELNTYFQTNCLPEVTGSGHDGECPPISMTCSAAAALLASRSSLRSSLLVDLKDSRWPHFMFIDTKL